MYSPWMLNDSKKISAVCSRFSGGFSGGSVYAMQHAKWEENSYIRKPGRPTNDRTDQKEIVVLGLGAQILEDRLFPVTLHIIPVVNHTMANRVVDTVSRRLGIGERLVTDEEVEVFDPAFRSEMARLCWYCGSRSARLGRGPTGRDGSWKYASKKLLCVSKGSA
jgi:hypothetical protein